MVVSLVVVKGNFGGGVSGGGEGSVIPSEWFVGCMRRKPTLAYAVLLLQVSVSEVSVAGVARVPGGHGGETAGGSAAVGGGKGTGRVGSGTGSEPTNRKPGWRCSVPSFGLVWRGRSEKMGKEAEVEVRLDQVDGSFASRKVVPTG